MRRPHCSRGMEPVVTRQDAVWDLETVSSDGDISEHLLKWNPNSLVVQPFPGLLSQSELHLSMTHRLHIPRTEICVFTGVIT
jgi:hypothetical protein